MENKNNELPFEIIIKENGEVSTLIKTKVQCRGYRNGDYTKSIRKSVDAFLRKYEKWFEKRIVKAA